VLSGDRMMADLDGRGGPSANNGWIGACAPLT
jgi:hypothetical protein